ncbi:MAG: QueT transporter family protein [Clostridia bacterium]|nr:QueT transporter family protein [Clostridia bacterium]
MLAFNMSKTKKIAFSGIIIALYIVIMYFTSSFAFGAFQIRIATALYSLSYAFPFLVLPLALANMLSNILSGQILDVIGGFVIGLLTSGAICLVRRIPSKWGSLLIVPIIILLPGFIVPIWLSKILSVPYWVLVASLLVGQIIPAIVGYLFITIILERIVKIKVYKPSKRKAETLPVELSDNNIDNNIPESDIIVSTKKRVFEDDDADEKEEEEDEKIL